MRSFLPRYSGWAIGVAGAIAMSGSASRYGAQGTLIPSAAPLPGTKGHAGPYFWADDRRIVSLKRTSSGYRPHAIDTRTGSVTTLPPIPHQYTQSELRNSWRLSPDGKRLLWAQQNGPAYRWILGEIDSGLYSPQPSQPFDPFRRATADWFPDGRAWIELASRGGRYEFRTNSVSEKVVHPFASARSMWRKVDTISDTMTILQVDSHRKVTAMIRQPMTYWRGELARIDLRTGGVDKTTASIPPNMGALGAAVSPDQDSLALTLWSYEPSSGFRLLGPILSSFGIRDQRTGTLRVIGANGGEPRDAGTIYWSADRRGWRRTGPWQLKWTPDSQRLSFAYADQIYTIRAP